MIRTASKRVELAKATVGFANQNLEAEKARFSVGRSTNNDVLLRQQELKSTEIQVVRATVDLLVGETTLAAMTGELLERYRHRAQGHVRRAGDCGRRHDEARLHCSPPVSERRSGGRRQDGTERLTAVGER